MVRPSSAPETDLLCINPFTLPLEGLLMTTTARRIRVALPLALLVAAAPAFANVLTNPGFESPSTSPGVEYFGPGDGWTVFGSGIFTVSSAVVTPNTGDQALKMFGGCCSGAFQQFPTNPGDTWNGGVWMRNDTNDLMANGQVAAVNIEWIQADGSTQSAILPFISNGTFTAADAPVNTWTLQTITGAAPADAAFARFVVITGDFQPGGPGGAPFYDDAFFELQPPVSVEESSFDKIKALYR